MSESVSVFQRAKKGAWKTVKFLGAVFVVVTGFVAFDDWYAQRTRLTVIPIKLARDYSLVMTRMFDLSDDELNTVLKVDNFDGKTFFKDVLEFQQIQAYTGRVAHHSWWVPVQIRRVAHCLRWVPQV